MKPWKLAQRMGNLSQRLDDSAESEARIDMNSLTFPERELFERIQEITDQYAPGAPPQDVIEKNADLWYKGLEIFGKRATELFVEIMPETLCCDELERWYFDIYFYNFLFDWLEAIKKLRDMPKEKRAELLVERREMGLLDVVFRVSRGQPEEIDGKKAGESKE